MPTAESVIKNKRFREIRSNKQLKEITLFIESGKEKPLKEYGINRNSRE